MVCIIKLINIIYIDEFDEFDASANTYLRDLAEFRTLPDSSGTLRELFMALKMMRNSVLTRGFISGVSPLLVDEVRIAHPIIILVFFPPYQYSFYSFFPSTGLDSTKLV